MTTLHQGQPHPWVSDARDAYLSAARGDLDGAARTVAHLITMWGVDELPLVMLAWVDTFATSAGVSYGRPFEIRGVNADTLVVAESTDDLTPENAWAARFMNARIALDRELLEALLTVPSRDERGAGPYVMAVLGACALSDPKYSTHPAARTVNPGLGQRRRRRR